VEALVVLGYRRNEATSSIAKIMKDPAGKALPLEQLIKEALKRI